LHSLRAVVFDFDGVLVESTEVKTWAFRELFKDFPLHQEKIVRLHKENQGISRFEKFEIIYRDFLKQPLSGEGQQRLSKVFSSLVYDRVLACPFVLGTIELLDYLESKVALFTASATPEEEVQHLVEEKGIGHYFQNVYGSPRNKVEIITDIVKKNGWVNHQVVFVGDAINDYDAARDADIGFIGRVPAGCRNPFPPDGLLAIVQDMRALKVQWPYV
jgi:phosphoglycolate phosphatase-like HAD superfamily hydrolase